MEDDSSLDDLDGPYYVDQITPLPQVSQIIEGFRVEEAISSTNFSFVFLGSNINTNEKVVLKFNKRMKETIKRLKSEISILLAAQNERILKIYHYFPYKEYVCIVSPYASYGSLYDYIKQYHPYGITSELASVFFKQMLQAIFYLHGLGIAHRDIKPGNFLVYDPDPKHPNIVLADLGLAGFLVRGSICREFMGTRDYSAPEIIAKVGYNMSADIWSLGISLFFMLTGNQPLPSFDKFPKDFKHKIVRGLLNYDLLEIMKISEDAIDLIQKLCHIAPNKRIKIEDALIHPFIASNQKQTEEEFEMDDYLYRNKDYEDDNFV